MVYISTMKSIFVTPNLFGVRYDFSVKFLLLKWRIFKYRQYHTLHIKIASLSYHMTPKVNLSGTRSTKREDSEPVHYFFRLSVS